MKTTALIRLLSTLCLFGITWALPGSGRATTTAPQDTATIKGQIKMSDGGSAEGVLVQADVYPEPHYATLTDPSGFYTLTVSPFQFHSLHFATPSERADVPTPPSPAYALPKSHDGLIILTTGEVREVNVTLDVGGLPTGLLIDAQTQLPVNEIYTLGVERLGNSPLLDFISVWRGVLNVNPTRLLVPGDYRVQSSSVLSSQVIHVEARKTTTVTLQYDNPDKQIERLLTIPGRPAVLGVIAPFADNQLFLSENAGQTWQRTYISDTQLALTPRAANVSSLRIVLADSQSTTPLRSGDLGSTWASSEVLTEPCEGTEPVPDAIGISNTFSKVTLSPRIASRLYAIGTCTHHGGGLIPASAQYNAFFISNDFGVTWQRQRPLDFWFFNRWMPWLNDTQLVPSLTEDNRLFAFNGWAVHESKDAGLNWVARSITPTIPFENYSGDLFADGAQPDTLYISQDAKLYASSDAGVSWQVRTLPAAANCKVVLSIPGQAGHLMARCSNVFYRSKNGGKSWQKLNTTGRQLFADYANPGRIYLEKYKDLWASDDEGDTWRAVRFDARAPSVPGKFKHYMPIVRS